MEKQTHYRTFEVTLYLDNPIPDISDEELERAVILLLKMAGVEASTTPPLPRTTH